MRTFPSGISSYGLRARVGVAAGLAIGVVAALVGVTSALAVAHPSGERTLTGAQLVSAGHGRSTGGGAAGSLAARDAMSAAVGRTAAAYAVRRGAGGRLGAENARGHLHITFSALGATVASHGDRVRFGLVGARSVAPTVSANRVSYRYAGITEWFVNGPAGLEQGFTIARPHPGGWLSVTVSAAGNRPARQVGSMVEFGGATGIGYGGLFVTDHRGRRLRAWLAVSDGRVRINVDAAGARYPVTIDPTINQSAELNAPGSTSLGSGVAMSGSTVVVGDPGTGTTNGRVDVYTEPAGGWQNTSQPTAVLTPNDAPNPINPNNFGESVAIDGGTIVVGATEANSGDGSVYVYDEPAGGWQTTSNQTHEINLGAGGAASGTDDFGVSVGVSGSEAAIGADGAGTNGNGEVFVVNLANNQTQTLNPSNNGSANQDGFGGSVAISGSTLVVAALGQGADGTVYIYNGLASSPTRVTGSGSSATFGWNVATNGSTVAVGAPQDGTSGGGEVDLYTAGGQPAGVLGDPNGQSADDFGVSVAMSGSTVVVGADQASANAPSASGNGLAYAFDTSGQQIAQLTYTDPSPNFTVNNDDFGVSVGASPNGIIVGADAHAAGGSAYVYGERLSAATSGSGTVTSTDGQISCPGGCSATYIPGAQVTLNATPATGSGFTGWSGACSGTGPCQVTMNQAQAVTATFAAQSGPPPKTAPPINTAPPNITGTGQVGATLACSPGQWTGSPTSYAYQWERNGAVIPGATTSTYTTTSADQNTTIQCLVTATNAGGSASAISNGITVANAQPPSATLALSRGQVVGHNHLRFSCTATTVNLARCTITALVHGRVLASGTAPGNGSTAIVQLTLTKYGLRLLGRHPSGVRVAIDAAATSTASQALTATRSVLLGMAQQMLIPAQGMFAPNLPQLTPFGGSFLRSVAADLRHRAARVVCLGYTAAPGDRLQNTPFSLALSQERAQVACKFLRRRHVSATYATEALGKIDPLVPNTTPANLARNRRVEFRVTSGLQIKG